MTGPDDLRGELERRLGRDGLLTGGRVEPPRTVDPRHLRGPAATQPRNGAEAARRLDTVAKRWRAKDVAGLRDGLLESWGGDRLLRVFLAHPAGKMNLPVYRRDVEAGMLQRWSKGEWCDFLMSRLPDADLFYVTADMTDLVINASAAAPSYQVHADRLPARTGFVVFEHPYCLVPPENLQPGQRIELSAAFWSTVDDIGGGVTADPVPGVMVVTLQDSGVLWWTQPVDYISAGKGDMQRFLSDRVRRTGPLAYHEEYPMPFGTDPWGVGDGLPVQNAAVAAIQTTWILMHQRLTETREDPPPRHKVERAAKRGERPPPAVRVVDLAPRPKRARGDAQQTRDGEPSRRYTRRWTVSGYGYWRDTWYPSRGRHEQQWVEVDAYVKGPEDAPWVPPVTRVLRKK